LSKNDPHPAIRHGANMDGWSQDAEIDPEAFAGYQQAKFVMSPPAHRMDALNQIDGQISDETATPRQRSELITLRRRLSLTHERLLALGK